MKRRVLSAMMVIALAASCLAGCGKKEAESEAPATEAAAEETEASASTEEADAEKTTSADNVIKIGVFEPLTGENGGGGLQGAYG